MELDIKAAAYGQTRKRPQRMRQEQPKQKVRDNEAVELQRKQQVEEQRKKALVSAENIDAVRYFKEILRFTEFFNKKLQFNLDETAKQVIVKVVDSETDKVIKEIPPAELRRLHRKMKEAIGLLIDEQR